MKTYKMRLYYVAYDYGMDEVECLDGPFLTYVNASDSLNLMLDGKNDNKLLIVCEVREVFST
jgi:hypothetical protein